MTDIIPYLKNEWDQLTLTPSFDKAITENYFTKIINAYSEPQRAYHTTVHLQQIFKVLHDAGMTDESVFWASFYHDYVYKPGAKDNEVLSASIASNQMEHIGVDKTIIERVSDLIIATKNHTIGYDDELGKTFLDADMSILGAASADYSDYVNSVRQEFSKTPGFLFKIGRSSFLKEVLSQKRIYKTEWFFNRFEESARKNIQKELNSY